MTWQFSADAHVALTCFETVDRTDVIETTAGHVRPGRRVRTGHHPAGSQRYRVHFVRRVRVPHDQLAVLRGGHQITTALERKRKEKNGQLDFVETIRIMRM